MDKQTAIYISHYLPYNLMFYHRRLDGEPTTPLTMNMIQVEGDVDIHFVEDCWMSDLVFNIQIENTTNFVKPILKPLEFRKNYSQWESEMLKIIEECEYDYRQMKVCHFKELLKNHYDLFGLIESGDAISIDKINFKK